MFKTSIIILILLGSMPLIGQEMQPEMEKIVLLSDRNLYISGEDIRFSAHLLSGFSGENSSSILYLELITPTGEQMIAGKFSIENKIASGLLRIPVNLLSGCYYLRAYTRYMRNSGPNSYGYCFLKIINPEKESVLNNTPKGNDPDFKQNGNNSGITGILSIHCSHDSLNKRQEAKVEIKADPSYPGGYLNTVVTIVPEGSGSFFIPGIGDQGNNYPLKYGYAMEDDRIIISGYVLSKQTGGMLSYSRVNLTILGDQKNLFYPVITDSSGKFKFNLPVLEGRRDIFISAEKDTFQTELRIENDFCTEPVSLPNPALKLSSQEKEIALTFARNHQVGEYFSNTLKNEDPEEVNPGDTIPFYGKAESITYLDEFIDLPLLADYFTELPVPVKVRTIKGEKKLFITGNQPELLILPPLVMIDYVPVYDLEELLAANPRNIYRIDVIPSAYVRGELTYGGIINILSRRKDFAGISLPSSGIFLNYAFIDPPRQSQSGSDILSRNVPDARNTLFWDSYAIVKKDTGHEFIFRAGDTSGPYSIIVSGISPDGNLAVSKKRIVVRED